MKFICYLAAVLLSGCGASTNEGVLFSLARKIGAKDAKSHVAANKLAVESFGMPAAWMGEYKKLLKSQYDIELRTVAGCVVDDRILGHAEGYNKVMETEIKRRFGGDALKRAQQDAMKARQEGAASIRLSSASD